MKMIKVSIYFYNNIDGHKLPKKVAIMKGGVQMPTNHYHGIRTSKRKDGEKDSRFFFDDKAHPLEKAISDCIHAYGVKIIKEEKIQEYKKMLKMKEKLETESTFKKDIK